MQSTSGPRPGRGNADDEDGGGKRCGGEGVARLVVWWWWGQASIATRCCFPGAIGGRGRDPHLCRAVGLVIFPGLGLLVQQCQRRCFDASLLLVLLFFFVVCAWCFCVSIVLKRRLNCSSLGFPQRRPEWHKRVRQ